LLAFLIFNRAMPNTLMSKYVYEDMKTLDIPMLESTIQQRVIYSSSAATGKTIYDFKNEDAKNEVNQLGEELLRKINER
jgi:cellulose biosynthesis protein BcsQ